MYLKSEITFNLLCKILFPIYLGILTWGIIFKCNSIEAHYNTYNFSIDKTLWERFVYFLRPFGDYIDEYVAIGIHPGMWLRVEDDILNIIAFVPVGLYLAYFVKDKKFVKVLALSFAISASFEAFQLFSMIGAFYSRDLMLNTAGGALGYLLYRLIYKKQNSPTKLAIFNVGSIVLIVACGALLIYATINTIKHIDIYVDILLRRLV